MKRMKKEVTMIEFLQYLWADGQSFALSMALLLPIVALFVVIGLIALDHYRVIFLENQED